MASPSPAARVVSSIRLRMTWIYFPRTTGHQSTLAIGQKPNHFRLYRIFADYHWGQVSIGILNANTPYTRIEFVGSTNSHSGQEEKGEEQASVDQPDRPSGRSRFGLRDVAVESSSRQRGDSRAKLTRLDQLQGRSAAVVALA